MQTRGKRSNLWGWRGWSIGMVQMLVATLLIGTVALAPVPTASAFSSPDADTAISAVINTFYNSSAKYFYTNSDHVARGRPGPQGGLYTDFWWEAQMWEMVMDAYARTNSSYYRTLIDDVYDGFRAYYPNFTNDFNDDKGWWALGSIRAYEMTNNSRYLTTATDIFNQITSSTELDGTLGGGVWWKNTDRSQKNVATNGPAVMIGAKLYQATGNSAYLTKATNIYSWIKSRLTDGAGRVYDRIENTGGNGTLYQDSYSYNFGTFIGAGVALYNVVTPRNGGYITDAKQAADWAKNNLTVSGVMKYEGLDDGGGFKGIFVRYLARLNPFADNAYLGFLQTNANSAWNNRRTSDNIIGADWRANPGSGYIQSLTAMSGATLLQVTAPDTGSGNGNQSLQAENGVLHNLTIEAKGGSFRGDGYLAGWNADGQYVDFKPVLGSSGTFNLTFRYAAAAGNASRYIYINGAAVAANLSFPNTGGWQTWGTVSVNNVSLGPGSTISVIYNSGQGSSNYINLDELSLSNTAGGGGGTSTTVQAENGTLHSLSVEANGTGWHGTGYLAGWNADGQWVDLKPNVSSGTYTLTFRYSAAAGNASRYIYVDGVAVRSNLSFPNTGGWSNWSTVSVTGVTLNSGSTVSVIYNSGQGSSNYINFDELTVSN